MTRNQLIEKHPELFLECVKEGIELYLYGITDINSLKDIERGNIEMRRREECWNIVIKEEEISSFI